MYGLNSAKENFDCVLLLVICIMMACCSCSALGSLHFMPRQIALQALYYTAFAINQAVIWPYGVCLCISGTGRELQLYVIVSKHLILVG